MWIAETAYGTTPTSALGWASEYYGLKDDSNLDVQPQYIGGDRGFQTSTRGPFKVGYTLKGVSRIYSASPAYKWTDFFSVNAFGAAQALTDHLPSFSSVVDIQEVTGSTVHDYILYNGCKISKLEIGGTDPGKILTFDATVMARMIQSSTTKAFVGLQNVTVGADPSAPASANPLTWSGIMQYNLNGGGLTNWQPRKWKLTIDNKLEPMPGVIQAADTAVMSYYPVPNTIEEGKREIMLELTLPARDQIWQNAKRSGLPVTAVKIPIDLTSPNGYQYINLANGIFKADDFPDYKQDGPNEETVKILFPAGLTVV
jgi:hypothetical protein